jgi:hypothetical protein
MDGAKKNCIGMAFTPSDTYLVCGGNFYSAGVTGISQKVQVWDLKKGKWVNSIDRENMYSTTQPSSPSAFGRSLPLGSGFVLASDNFPPLDALYLHAQENPTPKYPVVVDSAWNFRSGSLTPVRHTELRYPGWNWVPQFKHNPLFVFTSAVSLSDTGDIVLGDTLGELRILDKKDFSVKKRIYLRDLKRNQIPTKETVFRDSIVQIVSSTSQDLFLIVFSDGEIRQLKWSEIH